jgi:serine/threonine protein kinase
MAKRPANTREDRIDRFALTPGRTIGGRYAVQELIGAGWEGEVYRVVETATGITRAAKLFYPHRNEADTALRRYARKLDRLRECPAIISYHHTETVRIRGQKVSCMISEFVEGILLERFVKSRPGKAMQPFEALCLLHALAVGVEQIHAAGEYHGDLHPANVLVARKGIGFNIHIVDFFHRDGGTGNAKRDDVVDLAHLLHYCTGGKRKYQSQPQMVKDICKGLRRDLIVKAFPTATRLRRHLETFDWNG